MMDGKLFTEEEMLNKLNKIVKYENRGSKEEKKESKKKLKRAFELYGRKKSYEAKEEMLGDRKRNQKYHRFVVIGKDKVNIEQAYIIQ